MNLPPNYWRLDLELRDHSGVLYRALGVIRRHGYNIEQLHLIPDKRPGFRRATVVVVAADVTRVIGQLRRIVDVVSATASPLERSASWPSSIMTQMPTYDL